MIAIYAAMGLFAQEVPPNPTSPDPNRNWLASKLVPFAARMITEKLSCTTEEAEVDFVRVFVNDAMQPLAFCGDGSGICTLDEFVASQEYARSDGAGDFEACFA